ncbi:MBL fold metallo-hydrolase [Streptomyces sp. JW3]|uniref:MBL fold metallo-hydrolase n=1 Tax=Streptomyces sp. JW3 TaxID=3456955 RepID=UPI003FA4B29E
MADERPRPPSDLHHKVFVSGMVPAASPPAPDGGPSRWSSLSHTFVHGPTEALLTDPPITRAQADALTEWVKAQGVPLRYIYLTHAHADHFLTTNHLLRSFPEATVVATGQTLARIARETPGGRISERYTGFFGDALPEPPVTVHGTAVPAAGLELDGHQLFAVAVGHSDTDDTSVLHVPSLGLVVAGDVVYNNTHQYVGEGRDGGLDAWHRALDAVAGLDPRVVIAGHKDTRRPDLPSDIDETRRYLDTAAAVLDRAGDATEFFNALKERYPDRVNPWAIWLSARRLFADG